MQYREAHFNFVSRLLEQEGAYYYFDTRRRRYRRLCGLARRASALPKIRKLTSRALTSIHEHDQGVHVYDWIAESRHHTGKYQHTDYYFATPSADLKTPELNFQSSCTRISRSLTFRENTTSAPTASNGTESGWKVSAPPAKPSGRRRGCHRTCHRSLFTFCRTGAQSGRCR